MTLFIQKYNISLLVVVLLLLFTQCSRQSFVEHDASNDIDALERSVDELMYYDKYKEAIPYYTKLDSLTGGKNPNYKYKAAYCYYKANVHKEDAVGLLEDIDKKERDEFGADYYFYLAKAYHYTYAFDKAINAYNKFLEKASENDERISRVKQSIQMCKNGKKLTQDSVDVEITNMGDKINTSHSEYVPVISADESVLVFTSRRPGNLGGKRDKFGNQDSLRGQYYEDIYISKKKGGSWSAPKSIKSINTTGHDAAVALSPAGQRLFIYRSDSMKWGNLFECHKTQEGWSAPEKMPPPINSDKWEGSISITADGETVYFSSNREGGYGGKDLYVSHLKGPNEWSKPKNLGPKINTEHDDDAPFIHSDQRTLYFSSRGHNSIGGFDIYVSHLVDGQWTKPVNVGYPINTADDDIYFVLSADGQHGYYSSIREDSYGEKDLYQIDMSDHKKSNPKIVSLIKGKVMTQKDSTIIPDAVLSVTKPNKRKTQGSYPVGPQTGEYLISLKEGQSLVLVCSAPGYKYKNDTIHIKRNQQYNEVWHDFYLEEHPDTLAPGDTTLTASKDKKDTSSTTLSQQSTTSSTDTSVTSEQKSTQAQASATSKNTTKENKTTSASDQTSSNQTDKTSQPPSTKKSKNTTSTSPSDQPATITSMNTTVHFGFDKAFLTKKAEQQLDTLVEYLSKKSQQSIKVVGHTDSIGPTQYNKYLSKQRAQSVVDYLKAKGIDQKRIKVAYYGEQKPLVPNESRRKRRKNRRVTCKLID